MDKKFLIEALPSHKEICGFLIDKRISFTCYNGGLRAIVIEPMQHFAKYDFMSEIAEKFHLYLDSESKEYNRYIVKDEST